MELLDIVAQVSRSGLPVTGARRLEARSPGAVNRLNSPVYSHTTRSLATLIITPTTRQSQTADSAPGVATWEVTLSARKVPCDRWPATDITAHSL